jgi:hypothetical protein
MLAELIDAVVGVDTHRDTHEVEIALPTGTAIGTRKISNDSSGFAELLAWIVDRVVLPPGRCRNDARSLRCRASPLPASSGRTVRHRLNRGGDRALNCAIHTIAVTRMRCCPTTEDYVARRITRASPAVRSNAASSATSPASSTAPSTPAPPSPPRRRQPRPLDSDQRFCHPHLGPGSQPPSSTTQRSDRGRLASRRVRAAARHADGRADQAGGDHDLCQALIETEATFRTGYPASLTREATGSNPVSPTECPPLPGGNYWPLLLAWSDLRGGTGRLRRPSIRQVSPHPQRGTRAWVARTKGSGAGSIAWPTPSRCSLAL